MSLQLLHIAPNSFFSSHLIERKKSLVDGIFKIFCSHAGTMTQLVRGVSRQNEKMIPDTSFC